MGNLKQWIEYEAKGEEIVGVVIGEMGWGDYGSDAVPEYETHPRGKVLSWNEAAPLLDYDFNNGHGAPGCEAIYAWTTNHVIYISQYDGSTAPSRIPRNPTDIMPEMPGG